jgi:DNA-binding MarR family transcriptional regulator
MSKIWDASTSLFRLSAVLGRVSDQVLQDSCGLGMSQFKIIWVLTTHSDGVLQTNIASWLNLTEAAVSRQIGLLEDEGLIHKTVDPHNKRNHMIGLSAKGKKRAQQAMEVLTEEYKPYFATLTGAEKDSLNAMLEKIFFAVCKKNN